MRRRHSERHCRDDLWVWSDPRCEVVDSVERRVEYLVVLLVLQTRVFGGVQIPRSLQTAKEG